MACPIPSCLCFSLYTDDPHTALNVSWELSSGTCPYCNHTVSIFTWSSLKYGESVFPSSLNLFIFLNFPTSLLMATPVVHNKNPRGLTTLPSMHTANSVLSHMDFTPKLSQSVSSFSSVTSTLSLIPHHLHLDCGFSSPRVFLLQHILHTHCCKCHSLKWPI